MPDFTGNARVLIVDDESVIADTLGLILGKNGYVARVAYSGEEAVRLAEFEPPDILISDLLLSGIDGIQTAVEIRKLSPRCRVLLISGQAIDPKTLQAANADGPGFEVLLKPAHPQILLKRLKEIPAES